MTIYVSPKLSIFQISINSNYDFRDLYEIDMNLNYIFLQISVTLNNEI